MKHAHIHGDTRKHKTAYHPKCKHRNQGRKRWHTNNEAFRCTHCQQMVFPADQIGTTQRNHCPHCLWSRHVDTKPGNRASTCHGGMEPVGLTFKHNGFDKYGRARTGDVMLVHYCHSCGDINLNRIAGDDRVDILFKIFRKSDKLDDQLRAKIEQQSITLLTKLDEECLTIAIYGKSPRRETSIGGP